MATVTFVQEGDRLNYVATSGVTYGDVVSFTNFVGIAMATVASGETTAVKTKGVFTFPIATAGSIAVGTAMYWDASGTVVTTTLTSMVACGRLLTAKATGDSTCTVLIPMTSLS